MKEQKAKENVESRTKLADCSFEYSNIVGMHIHGLKEIWYGFRNIIFISLNASFTFFI